MQSRRPLAALLALKLAFLSTSGCDAGFVRGAGSIGAADSDSGASSTTDATTTTSSATCGDGVQDPGEECDNGGGNVPPAQARPTDCTMACELACGDGVMGSGEQCDDGNPVAGDGCEPNCTPTPGLPCGDGQPDPGEQCDNGASNVPPGQAGPTDCTTGCTWACGDGTKGSGEQCDDGNQVAGDGCEPDCTITPSCGDNKVDPGEQCDDGNMSNTDGCVNCTNATCGDGHIRMGIETCDNGGSNVPPGQAGPMDCTTACEWACGDGMKGSGEQCDDGNATSNDGCSATCAHEYLMFATKATHAANFGGVAGADALCAAAAAGKLAGTYAAWVSVDQDNAGGDLPAGQPLVRTDGQPIVAIAGDLIKGAMTVLMNPIDHDEDGEPVTGYAWTGTSPAGTATSFDCVSWTNAMGGFVTIGNVAEVNLTWTAEPNPGQCNVQYHLYCFRTLEP